MSELENKVEELLRRTKKTTKSRYRASERLERHHKFSQWTVAFISVALVFIPLMQAFNVETGIDAVYLNATQAILAVLVLVYSLLLGQENFVSRAQAMHRNGVELGRFARNLAAKNESIPDDEYHKLVEEYYDILEKYENHKPVDYLFTRLHEKPSTPGDWLTYIWVWIRAQGTTLLIYSHYIAALVFVAFIFVTLFSAIKKHTNGAGENLTPKVSQTATTKELQNVSNIVLCASNNALNAAHFARWTSKSCAFGRPLA